MRFQSIAEWQQYIVSNWDQLYSEARKSGIDSTYGLLVFIALSPILDVKGFEIDLQIILALPYGKPLADRLQELSKSPKAADKLWVMSRILRGIGQREDLRVALDYLLSRVGVVLAAFRNLKSSKDDFVLQLLRELRDFGGPSAVRVEIDNLQSKRDLFYVSGNGSVNVYNDYMRKTNKQSAFQIYLNALRTNLDINVTQKVKPNQFDTTLRDIFVQFDVWDTKQVGASKSLNQLQQEMEAANRPRRPVLEFIAGEPYLVLLGQPGSGKSTVASYLAVNLAIACESSNPDDNIGLRQLGPTWIHGSLLPIYVDLGKFTDSKHFPADDEDTDPTCIIRYIDEIYNFGEYLEEYLTNLGRNNSLQGAVLILDGLDEIPHAENKRERLRLLVENWTRRYKCRVLVTSRIYAYTEEKDWRLSNKYFAVAELAPFTEAQIGQFIYKWYFKQTPLASQWNEDAMLTVERTSSDLENTILTNPDLIPLAENPLLLTLITLIHFANNGRLPQGGYANLYEETIRLLNTWNPPADTPGLSNRLRELDLERLRDTIQVLAYEKHRDEGESNLSQNVTKGRLYEAIDSAQRRFPKGLKADTDAIMEYLASRNSILLPLSNNSYRYPHRTFQEFLAACALIENADACEKPPTLRLNNLDNWSFPTNLTLLTLSDADRWRQVALFAGARLISQRNYNLCWEFINGLLPQDQPSIRLAQKLNLQQLKGVYLAARIWYENNVYPRQVVPHNAIKEHLLGWVKSTIGTNSLAISDQMYIGVILAILGDNRTGVTLVRNNVPEIAFVELHPGVFLMGNDSISSESPQHQVKIEYPFEISAYPITVAQFNAFITASDGYVNVRWWDFSDEARIWRQNAGLRVALEDQRFLNTPQTRVTWFEAMAFCRWLSSKGSSIIRLPTEAEWEYAARGNTMNAYSWGDEFEEGRCNSIELGFGQVCAVGLFKSDDYPNLGIHDLCGQVAEWCLTLYREKAYPYFDDDRNIETTYFARVLRGGSYLLSQSDVRITSRHAAIPETTAEDIGFRVVRMKS